MLKLFRYLKPFRLFVIGVLVFVFLQTLSDLYLPTLMADIVDKGVSTGDKAYIWKIGGFIFALVAAGAGYAPCWLVIFVEICNGVWTGRPYESIWTCREFLAPGV